MKPKLKRLRGKRVPLKDILMDISEDEFTFLEESQKTGAKNTQYLKNFPK